MLECSCYPSLLLLTSNALEIAVWYISPGQLKVVCGCVWKLHLLQEGVRREECVVQERRMMSGCLFLGHVSSHKYPLVYLVSTIGLLLRLRQADRRCLFLSVILIALSSSLPFKGSQLSPFDILSILCLCLPAFGAVCFQERNSCLPHNKEVKLWFWWHLKRERESNTEADKRRKRGKRHK